MSFFLRLMVVVTLSFGAVTPCRATAPESWRAFYTRFSAAVEHRDRGALREMMARDFYFSPGGGDDNQDGDSRDEAFAFWDDPHVEGCRALEQVVRQGTAPAAAWWQEGHEQRVPMRVAPGAANHRKVIEATRIDWYALFEQREGGQWSCTSFVQCCD